MKKLIIALTLIPALSFGQIIPKGTPLKIDVAKLQYREAKGNSILLYIAGASFIMMSQEKSADGFRGLLFLTGAAFVFEGTRIRWAADERYLQARIK